MQAKDYMNFKKKVIDKLQFQTVRNRQFLEFILRYLDYRRSRSRILEVSNLEFYNEVSLSEFQTEGVTKLDPKNLGLTEIVNDVILECDRILAEDKNYQVNRSKKNYLQAIKTNLDFDPNSSIFQLAFSKELISCVAHLIEDFPVLANIALLYSPPSQDAQVKNFSGSQLFHMDEEDTKLCKVWLFLEDVDIEDGPTVVLKKYLSYKIASKLNYRKGEKIEKDEKILGLITKNDLITITGKKGDLLALDTAGSFHYGSRTTSKSKGRFMLMICYSTSFNLDHGILGRNSVFKNFDFSKINSKLSDRHMNMLVDSSIF
jgi:hypothetical protein